MITNTELTCINCPLGCALTIASENGSILSVTGNTCQRGEAYARAEIHCPGNRPRTTSVPVLSGSCPMVSVKTASAIPKGKIFDCIAALKNITAAAPIAIGDVILQNVADTGIDVVATKDVSANLSPIDCP